MFSLGTDSLEMVGICWLWSTTLVQCSLLFKLVMMMTAKMMMAAMLAMPVLTLMAMM